MPTYEYRCDKGHTFEVVQRMTEEPVVSCETCGQPVQRVFYPVAVHFKGSGFYNTDYGTRKRQRETAAAAEGSSSGDSGDSKKDSKKESKGSSESGSSDGGSAKKKDGGASKSASADKKS